MFKDVSQHCDMNFILALSQSTNESEVKMAVLETFSTLHWRKKSIMLLVMFPSYAGYFNSHHIPVLAPMSPPLLPILLCLFEEDSSLQSVILPLQRICSCLSAQRNCLPAPNLKIKRVMRRDCPHLSHGWQAWTVVKAYCESLLLKMGTYKGLDL